ncbi:MAG: MnmC family methyltransferase [Candidatus Melainabacteria bacterium]|nr:MnmC family methyltransferase [Candidatus Melainabacteria bacterium]
MSNFSIATTEDGSLSLHENNLNELYHNRAGAFTEAVTNYVEPAMQFLQLARAGGSLQVLDSCFGLGYNSLALANYLATSSGERSCSFKLAVEGIELDQDVLAVVPQVLAQSCFAALEGKTLEQLNFKVRVCDLRQFLLERKPSSSLYDLIFHDPFSPKKVPELWSVDLFQHYHRAMAEDSALLTYACAPAVRGALLSLGFKVFRTTGLGRKNGGTIAIKTSNPELVQALLKVDSSCIFEIVGEELRRLGKSSQVPFRDANLNDDRRTILIRREAEQQEFRRNDAVNS